jgi:hypothetical protein
LFMNSTNFQQKILDYLISIISSQSFPHCEYRLRGKERDKKRRHSNTCVPKTVSGRPFFHSRFLQVRFTWPLSPTLQFKFKFLHIKLTPT